ALQLRLQDAAALGRLRLRLRALGGDVRLRAHHRPSLLARPGEAAMKLGAAAVLAFFLGPLAWQVLTSLWPEPELTRPLPDALTLANYAGLGSTFARALTLWLLPSSFRERPDELYRAARVDGCSPWQAFVHVFLPLAWPALATCAILVFIFSWNELLYALSFLSTPSKRTIPVAI